MEELLQGPVRMFSPKRKSWQQLDAHQKQTQQRQGRDKDEKINYIKIKSISNTFPTLRSSYCRAVLNITLTFTMLQKFPVSTFWRLFVGFLSILLYISSYMHNMMNIFDFWIKLGHRFTRFYMFYI